MLSILYSPACMSRESLALLFYAVHRIRKHGVSLQSQIKSSQTKTDVLVVPVIRVVPVTERGHKPPRQHSLESLIAPLLYPIFRFHLWQRYTTVCIALQNFARYAGCGRGQSPPHPPEKRATEFRGQMIRGQRRIGTSTTRHPPLLLSSEGW